MLIVLIILKLIEEIIIGLIHSKSFGELIAEFGQASLLSLVGPTLLMLLILVPMMFALELDRALGEKGLKRLMLDGGQ
jgi:hypothetical protein